MHSSCLTYLEGKEVSDRFKRIAILHLVAGAVGRKIYLLTRYGPVYPAPITGLVGKPGTGKSQVISPIETIIRELAVMQKLYVAPRNMTVAGLAESLYNAKRTFDKMDKRLNDASLNEIQRLMIQCFHHLSIFAPELGVMTGKYDPNMLQTLSNLYDCEPVWDEGKRGFKSKAKEEDSHIRGAVNPIVPVLFGTQPRYMTEFIPVSAWEQGFAARAWFVYVPELAQRTKGLFDFDETTDNKLHLEIAREVERLSTIEGRMELEPGAIELLENFYLTQDQETAPKHSLLSGGWNTRRTLRLEMYSMMYALCRREALLMTRDDVEIVLGWMLEDEQFLITMLEDIGTSEDSEVMRSVWELVRREHTEKNIGTPMTRIRMFIAQRGDVHKALKYIRELEEMGAIYSKNASINGIEDTTKKVFYPTKGFNWGG